MTMTSMQRRANRAAEIDRFRGRADFPDSITSPRSDDNSLASYCVLWTASNGRTTGNSWSRRETAERVAREKIGDGSFVATMTTYFAGWAF